MVDLARRQPKIADPKLQESIAAFENIPDKEPLLLAMAISALVNFHIGQEKEARQKLYESLRMAIDTYEFLPLLYIFLIIALLLTPDRPTLGMELYTLTIKQPHFVNSKWLEIVAGSHIKRIINDLPQDIAILARSPGQEQDWWKTAGSLLTELTELGWVEAG
jgi:hypothetical protein